MTETDTFRDVQSLDGTQRDRRFVQWFCACVAVIVVLVAGFNAIVDPFGDLGTGIVDPIEVQASERASKLDLLDRRKTPPDIVLLGTSTTRMVSPHDIRDVAGSDAMNLSVSGSTTKMAFATVAYLADIYDSNTFPHVVWGIDVEAFSDRPQEDITDPRLIKQLSAGEVDASWTTIAARLFDLRTISTSIDAIQVDGESNPSDDPVSRLLKKFDDSGLPRKDPLVGKKRLSTSLENQIESYAEGVYNSGSFDELNPDLLNYVERLAVTANERGDTPTFVIMPVHPTAQARWNDLGRADRTDDLVRWLNELSATYDVQIVDASSLDLDGIPDDFHDAVHMTAPNMRRFAAYLESVDALQ